MTRHGSGEQMKTDRAWLAGFDAGIVGFAAGNNPYKRREYHRAWERGRNSGRLSSSLDIEQMQLRQSRLDRRGDTEAVGARDDQDQDRQAG